MNKYGDCSKCDVEALLRETEKHNQERMDNVSESLSGLCCTVIKDVETKKSATDELSLLLEIPHDEIAWYSYIRMIVEDKVDCSELYGKGFDDYQAKAFTPLFKAGLSLKHLGMYTRYEPVKYFVEAAVAGVDFSLIDSCTLTESDALELLVVANAGMLSDEFLKRVPELESRDYLEVATKIKGGSV